MLRSAPLRHHALALGTAALLVCGACGGRQAPAGGTSTLPGVDPAALQPPPVHSLLGYRERLELSSVQITRLDSIGQWLDAQRRAAGAALPAGGRRIYGPGGRPTPEDAAALESIADLHRAAAAAVEATLTERQREQVCEIRRAEATPAREGDGQGRRLYGPGAGARGGTRIRHGPYVWPWCRSEPA